MVVKSMTTITGSDPGFVALREQTCAALDELDTAAKGRANIVRSCTESKNISNAERESLKDLLRCITDHRKRLRAVRRLWRSLDSCERPSAELVEATQLCMSEARELGHALDPWRTQTIDQVTRSIAVTWSRLARAADRIGDGRVRETADPLYA